MVIACLYLLCWNYDRVKYILPFKRDSLPSVLPKQILNNKFPWLFSIFVACTLIGVTAFSVTIFDFLPRNTIKECQNQFKTTKNKASGFEFCDCIHNKGMPLDEALRKFEQANK